MMTWPRTSLGGVRSGLPVLLALATGCTPTLTSYNPSPTQFATFAETAASLDPSPASTCDPETPPKPTPPAPPGSAEVLVGNQLWRDTIRDSTGRECTTSSAARFEGAVAFDMSQVVMDITNKPFKTLSGTLRYQLGATLQVPSTNDLPMCVASIERSATAPTSSGVIPLSFGSGQAYPPSSPPSLGARTLPASVPFGQVFNSGGVTIDPAGPFPTVTLDLSLLLSDWAAGKSPQLGVVFVPVAPTLESLGIGNTPPTPIPDSLSTAQCTTIVKNVTFTVNVGR